MLQIVAKYFKLLRTVVEKFTSFGVVPLSLISYQEDPGKTNFSKIIESSQKSAKLSHQASISRLAGVDTLHVTGWSILFVG